MKIKLSTYEMHVLYLFKDTSHYLMVRENFIEKVVIISNHMMKILVKN